MTSITSAEPLETARAARFRPFLVLLAGVVGVSLAMELVLVAESAAGTAVAGAVWGRCSAVLASAIVLLLLLRAAARGSRPAYVRTRIISVVVVAAVVVIVSIPDLLPPWVRLEQGLVGGLVLPVAILVNMGRTRALFPKRA